MFYGFLFRVFLLLLGVTFGIFYFLINTFVTSSINLFVPFIHLNSSANRGYDCDHDDYYDFYQRYTNNKWTYLFEYICNVDTFRIASITYNEIS